MQAALAKLSFEIQLLPGEKLELPQAIVDSVGPGQWLITVQPLEPPRPQGVRSHAAFLNAYAPEDEGLYDDYPSR